MLVKEFLKNVQPNLKVVVFDTDKIGYSQRKEAEAGVMALNYHFNNSNVVDNFIIFEDVIYIYTSRH